MWNGGKNTIGGIEKREQEAIDITARRHSLGDAKDDLGIFGAPWVPSEGVPPQAKNRPPPGADRYNH